MCDFVNVGASAKDLPSSNKATDHNQTNVRNAHNVKSWHHNNSIVFIVSTLAAPDRSAIAGLCHVMKS